MKAIFKSSLIIVGEFLLISGVNFLYRNWEVSSIYWLDISIITIIYIVIILNNVDKLNNCKVFNRQTGGMGILWTISFFYILSALALIIVAHNYWLAIGNLLLSHLILLLLLSLGVYFSYYANRYTVPLKKEDNIRQMLDYIELIDNELENKGNKDLKEEIRFIKNELNTLSPSSNSNIMQLNEYFIDEASRILMIIQTSYSGDYNAVKFNLNKCKRILDERKKYYFS
jgi:predicted acyltransferase